VWDAGLHLVPALSVTGGGRRLVLRTQRRSVEARPAAHRGAQENGIHEVMGSIPISSTNPDNNLAGLQIR